MCDKYDWIERFPIRTEIVVIGPDTPKGMVGVSDERRFKMNDVDQMSKGEILEKVRDVRSGKVVHPLCRDRFYPVIMNADIGDKMSRIAEKTISYRARRAIEMYIPCYIQDKEFCDNIFCIGANHLGLSRDEHDKCCELMAEFGMIEKECRNDHQWNLILGSFPDITVNGYKIHESSKKSFSIVGEKLYIFIHLKWSEDTGLAINRDDVESFDGVNVILKTGKKEV